MTGSTIYANLLKRSMRSYWYGAKMTAYLWHINADVKRNSRDKIIERIDHDKKLHPTSMQGVHDKFLRGRAKSGTGFKKIGKMV